jgi:hypothetical protein
VSKQKTRARAGDGERAEREGRGWSARVAIMAGLQRRGREKRGEKKKRRGLAKIHLKFEKFKIWYKWWW